MEAERRDARLERPGGVDGAEVEGGEAVAAALGEAEGVDVVVGGDRPGAAAAGGGGVEAERPGVV